MNKPTFDNAQLTQLIAKAPAYVAVADDTPNLAPGQWTVRLDEANNQLRFVVKYSDGITVKSGTISVS